MEPIQALIRGEIAYNTSQTRMAVWKGLGPPGIDRIDPPHLPGEQWHAHLGPGVGNLAVNQSGTWRQFLAGKQRPRLTKLQKTFLTNAGSTV